METKAISILSGYMYFADISIVNSKVREAYAHVYHLVLCINHYSRTGIIRLPLVSSLPTTVQMRKRFG